MSTIKNPAAFPNNEMCTEGMSLRDWFAGQALSGFAANKDFLDRLSVGADNVDLSHQAALAQISYKQADAMLAERAK